MSNFKVPQIYCIDGVDGSGKATTSKRLEQELVDKGLRVYRISPPFYNTRHGQLVKSYLQKGYQHSVSRIPAALIYSNDRNIHLMENFDEIFCSDKYDVVIYDRSWLSSLLFHSALICATPAESYRLLTRYEFDEALPKMTLGEWHDLLYTYTPDASKAEPAVFTHSYLNQYMQIQSETTPSHIKAMRVDQITDWCKERADLNTDKWLYLFKRRQATMQLMKVLYDAEVSPWRVDGIPFPTLGKIRTVVLTPHFEPSFMHQLKQNMLKRYNGDESKLDHHEASLPYLAAVAENIQWIHDNYAQMFTPAIIQSVPKLGEHVNRKRVARFTVGQTMGYPLPQNMNMFEAFNYEIVHTNVETAPDVQRSLDDIYADVTKALGVN